MSCWLLLAVAAMTSAEPRIELYTMGRGGPLFERFGHAALCVVHDADPEADRCYNYGTTNFDSPPHEIGWRFLRGNATFWVSVATRERMLDAYVRADRTIWRQRLLLTRPQARRVVDRLAHDARSENRAYAYHHLYDNCSTRLRDLLDAATDGSLSRGAEVPFSMSYREIGRQRLSDWPGLLVAADLLVGRAADRAPTVREAMFLPQVLSREASRRLGAEPELVYRRQAALPGPGVGWDRHWGMLLGAALAVPQLVVASLRRGQRLIRGLVGVLLGSLGLLLWAVAASTAVQELRCNEALLLFVPTDLLLALPRGRWLLGYLELRMAGLLVASLALSLGLLRQPLLGAVLAAGLPLLVAWVAVRTRRPWGTASPDRPETVEKRRQAAEA